MNAQRWMQQNFGCQLHDEKLLKLALSHRSVGQSNNERLEFLGDAVLGYVISEALYLQFPEADEGQLSLLRVSLVKGRALAALARDLQLGDQLHLGGSGVHGGARRLDSVLADSLEALFGAITLDQGLDTCREAIHQVFASRLDALRLEDVRKDPKTRLQEYLQARQRALPDYQLVRTHGKDHERSFVVCCRLGDDGVVAQGSGNSRRVAEQAAAQALLSKLETP